MSLSLEQEFTDFLIVHKYAVLKANLMKYYYDLQNTGITIPSFLEKETPEEKADKFITSLMLRNDNLKLFNEKYNLAWNEIAEFMD